MDTNTPTARTRGLALIALAVALVLLNGFVAVGLGDAASWVVVGASVVVLAVAAAWTSWGADR